MRGRLVGVGACFGLLIAVVVVYFIFILEEAPPGVAATVHGTTAQLTLQTDGAYGHAPYPDWVTYEARDPSGHWQHSTILKIPAARATSTSRSTSTTPLPGFATRSSPMCAARSAASSNSTVAPELLDAASPAHTFTAPDIGLNVPLPGIGERQEPVLGGSLQYQRGAQHDQLHLQDAGPGTTASSASSRARSASSTGSAGRCRRSATWTA